VSHYAVLTALGRDRPGIIAAVSGVLYHSGCNIESSTISRLGNELTMMLMIKMAQGLTDRELLSRLEQTSKQFGLHMQLTDILPEDVVQPSTGLPRFTIRTHGKDQMGVVHRISSHLAEKSVNIIDMHTEVTADQPPQYIMSIEVELPPYLDAIQLADELHKLAHEQDMKITFHPSHGIDVNE